MKISELLSLENTIAGELFAGLSYPWQALELIKDFILKLGEELPAEKFYKRGGDIWIARSAIVYSTAFIAGPCIIDENAEIRHGAFIRGSAIVGKNAVVGNSAELKNVVLFDGVQVPHYNYVGDSILGYKAHMGAGSITSNVKGDKTHVCVCIDGQNIDTGRKKFGAVLGDRAEIGCNSVLNPGTILGRDAMVYPLSSVRGTVPPGCIYKSKDNIVKKY